MQKFFKDDDAKKNLTSANRYVLKLCLVHLIKVAWKHPL